VIRRHLKDGKDHTLLQPALNVPVTPEQPTQTAVEVQHPAIAYLESLFEEDDHIFFQLIHSTKTHIGRNGTPEKDTRLLPLMLLKDAVKTENISRLEALQTDGWNIYICMNPFPTGTETRKERFVKVVRNLYFDADKDSEKSIAAIREDVAAGIVPPLNSLLCSSPEKFHGAWNLEGMSPAEAKPLLRVLASRYGTDMAATDLHRVLRVPGFKNLKYDPPPVCVLTETNWDQEYYTREDFKLDTVPIKADGKPIASEELETIVDYIEQNAAEAKVELGSREEDGAGYKWVIECPWANVHTHGGTTALIMLLEDGRVQFNCFHDHCSSRGWSNVRKLWEEKVGHFQRFGDPNPSPIFSDGKQIAGAPSNTTPEISAEPANVEPPTPPTKYKITLKVNENSRRHTDLGNAERLVDAFGDDIKFCNETGHWYVWTGTKWQVSGKTGPQLHMQAVARMIREEATLIRPKSESAEDLKEAEELRNTLLKWGHKSESNNAITGAINQARALPKVQIRASEFDANIYLLNLANGTLDLKTGDFKAHDKNDFLTKIANVSYDPTVKHPIWTTFLNKSVPDKDTQRFLAQAAGYTLTGDVSEDCLFLLIGSGRNGKGVFLNTLKWILGDYAQQANFDSFVVHKGGGGIEIRSDIARMEGARMVIASENEEDQRIAESLLKLLTGSDTVTSRKHYVGEVEYAPQFKLWFGVNHEPRITGVDEGIWSRIHRVPFNVYLKPEERIIGLKNKILFSEAAGVLNWLLAGLKDYQQNRLTPSEEVKKATADYRKSSDVIQRFVNEKCIINRDQAVLSSRLYSEYKTWCERSGEYYAKEKLFREYLENRNYKKEHREAGATWVGLGLRPEVADVTFGVRVSTGATPSVGAQ
jgi:P4 family phage/plasmid primase-like protien